MTLPTEHVQSVPLSRYALNVYNFPSCYQLRPALLLSWPCLSTEIPQPSCNSMYQYQHQFQVFQVNPWVQSAAVKRAAANRVPASHSCHLHLKHSNQVRASAKICASHLLPIPVRMGTRLRPKPVVTSIYTFPYSLSQFSTRSLTVTSSSYSPHSLANLVLPNGPSPCLVPIVPQASTNPELTSLLRKCLRLHPSVATRTDCNRKSPGPSPSKSSNQHREVVESSAEEGLGAFLTDLEIIRLYQG